MSTPNKKVIPKASKKLYVGSLDGKYIWGMEASPSIDKVCSNIYADSGEEEITIYELTRVGTYKRGGWTKK